MNGLNRYSIEMPEDDDRSEKNPNHQEHRRVMDRHQLHFIKILRKIPIFSELTVPQFAMILNICSKRALKEGEVLFRADEESDEMYLLITGVLKVTFRDGREFSRIKPLGIVGEMGIFTGEYRSATVEALTDSIVLCIHRIELMRLFEKDTLLANHVLKNVIRDLSKKLRNNNIIIEEMRQETVTGEFTRIISNVFAEDQD